MNEQIKKIANEAHASIADKWPCEGFTDMFNSVFAESIVKECISICSSNALDEMDPNGGRSSAKSAFDIKQHFGVEQ